MDEMGTRGGKGAEFAALVLRSGDGTPDDGHLDRYEMHPDPCGRLVAYRRR